MKDFDTFFLKDKTGDKGCLAGCSNTSQKTQNEGNFTDVFKKQRARFFDIDKVLKEVE